MGIIERIQRTPKAAFVAVICGDDKKQDVVELVGTRGKWDRLRRVLSGYQWTRVVALGEDRKPLDGWNRTDIDLDSGKETLDDSDSSGNGTVDLVFRVCDRWQEKQNSLVGVAIRNLTSLVERLAEHNRKLMGTVDDALDVVREQAKQHPTVVVAEPDTAADAEPKDDLGKVLAWLGAHKDEATAVLDMLEERGILPGKPKEAPGRTGVA